MNPSLRQATAADAPRVASLLIDTRAAFMSYAPSTRSDDEVRTWVASQLVPSGGVVVAEIQGSIVAAIHTEWKDATLWITQMAVDPPLVGKGIGSSLLTHVMRTMALPIRLYTFQANAGARRFYNRHGFVELEFRDGRTNEERCPDVLYELSAPRCEA
jgi:GNAT superfamily N-acetyltransferase